MWSGGWQVALLHLSCPKIFRVGRTECGSGVAKALSQAARHVLFDQQGGWVSRAEGALSTDVWDRPSRCDKSIFHKVRFAYCEPILCAAPGASSSCCSVTCGTFEPEGSGWGAASSVVQCIVRD
jgi:hypothetical protein